MKTFSLFFLAALSAQNALGAEVLLTCIPKNGKPSFEMSRKSNSPPVYTMKAAEGVGGQPPLSVDLKLIGRTTLNLTSGPLTGSDPVPTFVESPNINGSLLYFSPTANSDGTHNVQFTSHYSGYSLLCTPGPAFASLEQDMRAAQVIDRITSNKLSDQFLALDCQSNGAQNKNYTVRSMTPFGGFGGYAEISVSFSDPANNNQASRSEFDLLTFGKNNNFVLKRNTLYGDMDGPRLYIQAASIAGPNGKPLHAVTFVPDLKKSELGMEDLICSEEQAYPSIPLSASQILTLPKALPARPGTASEIDQSLCVDDIQPGFAEAKRRVNIWGTYINKTRLSFRKKGGGWGISPYTDKVTHCQGLSIYLQDQSGIDEVKAVIGESIDGIGIRYSH